MDTTLNTMNPETNIPDDKGKQASAAVTLAKEMVRPRPGDDVVRWGEFRLALWIGGIALAAILGGQAFLYSAIIGLQGEMHALIGGVRTEMHTQVGGLREDIHTQVGGLRADMHTQFTEVRESIHELSERVARIETRLDLAVGPADKGT